MIAHFSFKVLFISNFPHLTTFQCLLSNSLMKIKVFIYSGLTTDFCKKIKANYILRGLRNSSDFEYENSIAQTNKKTGEIETVFLLSSPEKSFISSSIVREIIKYNGKFEDLVPNSVKT